MRQRIYLLLFLLLFSSRIVIAQSNDADNFIKNGTLKYSSGDYAGALEEYNNAIKLAKDTIGKDGVKQFWLRVSLFNALSFRANAKSKLGDNSGAMSDYNSAIELNKNDLFNNNYFNRGLIKRNLGDYRGAVSDFDKAIEVLPKNVNRFKSSLALIYYLRGLAKAQMGRMDDACTDWSQAGELGYSKAYEIIKENCNK